MLRLEPKLQGFNPRSTWITAPFGHPFIIYFLFLFWGTLGMLRAYSWQYLGNCMGSQGLNLTHGKCHTHYTIFLAL